MTEGPPDRQPAISLEVRQTVGKVIETQAPVKTLNSAKDILPIGSSQFGREADKAEYHSKAVWKIFRLLK